MVCESGAVNDKGEARLVVRLVDGTEIECVIDTAFDGVLMLPRAFTEMLKMSVTDQTDVTWFDDTRVRRDVGRLRIRWLSAEYDAEVIVNEGDDSLLGTLLLAGTRLTIDYVARTVLVEKLEP
jgi:clan AA aspartic protease